MSAKYLLIPDSALSDVRRLVALNTEQLTRLDAVLADKSLVKSGEKTYRIVASELGVGHNDALGILSAVRNLRRQRERYDLNDEDMVADVVLAAGADPSNDGEYKAALARVFRKNDEDYFVEKLVSLKHALVPHFLEAKTIVEARPVFSRDRESVDGLLLVAYLLMSTHDSASEDYEQTKIQLTREDIDSLIKTLEDAKKKLSTLTSRLKDFELYE